MAPSEDVTGGQGVLESIVQLGGLPFGSTVALLSHGTNTSQKSELVSGLDMLRMAGVVIDRPLVSAAVNGHEAVVSALLAAGADMDKVDGSGDTPLRAAVANGHE